MVQSRIAKLVAADYLTLRHERMFVFLFVLMTALSAIISGRSPWFLLLFGLFPVMNFIGYTFAFDSQGADRLFASLPVRRRDIVRARYLGAGVVVLSLVTASYLLNALLSLLAPKAVLRIPGSFFAYFALLFALVAGIMLPVYFRVGVVKARAALMLVYVAPAVLAGIFLRLGGGVLGPAPSTAGNFLPPLPPPLLVFLPLLALLLLALSLRLSRRYYQAREL